MLIPWVFPDYLLSVFVEKIAAVYSCVTIETEQYSGLSRRIGIYWNDIGARAQAAVASHCTEEKRRPKETRTQACEQDDGAAYRYQCLYHSPANP